MWVQSLGPEDPLEKEMATHSSILAWEIPWTEELAGYSPRGHKESDMTERLINNSILVEQIPSPHPHLLSATTASQFPS